MGNNEGGSLKQIHITKCLHKKLETSPNSNSKIQLETQKIKKKTHQKKAEEIIKLKTKINEIAKKKTNTNNNESKKHRHDSL